MSSDNPFADLEDDFKAADKAAPGSAPGRVPPGTYKFVLTTNDPVEGKALVDFETFVGKTSGTKGFKLFCEIVDPPTMQNSKGESEEVKGRIVEHVFWITKDNSPYVKRDVATILGRELTSLGELVKLTWAGRTFEGVVKDETYQGMLRSRIAFINPWQPDQQGATAPDKGAKQKKSGVKAAAPASAGEDVPF